MIDMGDRIYATEMINFTDGYDSAECIVAGTEGTVAEVRKDVECCELLVEWDSGYLTAADASSVALVPAQVAS